MKMLERGGLKFHCKGKGHPYLEGGSDGQNPRVEGEKRRIEGGDEPVSILEIKVHARAPG